MLLAGAKKPHGTTQNFMGSGPMDVVMRTTLRHRVLPLPTGAGCQGTSSSPAKGKVFSLDIPFYRTLGVGQPRHGFPSVPGTSDVRMGDRVEIRKRRMNVLVLNSGSSSLKFQVIATDLDRIRDHQDDRICRGEVEGMGGEAVIRFQHRDDRSQTLTAPLRDIACALEYLVRFIASERSGVTEMRALPTLTRWGIAWSTVVRCSRNWLSSTTRFSKALRTASISLL